MSRLHNFCAGPCVLPVSVLEQLANDMVDYKGSGMSLIEMSHRGPIYEEVHLNTMASLRRLYAVQTTSTYSCSKVEHLFSSLWPQ